MSMGSALRGQHKKKPQVQSMMRESLLSSTSSPDEDKLLQDLQRKQEMKIIQNNFTLLIIFNIVNYLLFLFSFSFYMWYQLEMELIESRNSEKEKRKIWLNMLYVFNQHGDDNTHYMTFNAYRQSTYFICHKYKNQAFCEDQFNQMEVVGYICFALLMLGVLLQSIDLYRLCKLRANHDNRSNVKAYWLHPMIICTYIVGFFTYFFTVLYQQISNKEMSFDLGSFGVSFWIGIASIPIYIFLIIYYRQTKNKLKSSELVGNLIYKIDVFEQSQKDKKKLTINQDIDSNSSSQKPENEN